jgi:hypothetical protein
VSLGAAAPQGGTTVTLASSNTAVATVPASVLVAGGASSATFSVSTSAVTSPTTATITATGGGASATASMTVTPAATTTTDTVQVTLAEYVTSTQVLNVQATSTSGNATLQAFVTSSGALIGTLTNSGGGTYQGQLSWPTNPQNVTVTSSLGGSGSLAVTPK